MNTNDPPRERAKATAPFDERSRPLDLAAGAVVPPDVEALAKEYEEMGFTALAAELRASAAHVIIAHTLPEMLRRVFEKELSKDNRDCPGCGG